MESWPIGSNGISPAGLLRTEFLFLRACARASDSIAMMLL